MTKEELQYRLWKIGVLSILAIVLFGVQFLIIWNSSINESLVEGLYRYNVSNTGAKMFGVQIGRWMILIISLILWALLLIGGIWAVQDRKSANRKNSKMICILYGILSVMFSVLLVLEFVYLNELYLQSYMFLSVCKFLLLFSPTIAIYVCVLKGFSYALSLWSMTEPFDKRLYFGIVSVADDWSSTYKERVYGFSRTKTLFFSSLICFTVLFFLIIGIFGKGYEASAEVKDCVNLTKALTVVDGNHSEAIIVPSYQFDNLTWACCGEHYYDLSGKTGWFPENPSLCYETNPSLFHGTNRFAWIPTPGKQGWIIYWDDKNGSMEVSQWNGKYDEEDWIREMKKSSRINIVGID